MLEIWYELLLKKKGVNLYYTILYIYYKLRIWWWNSTPLVAHWLLLSRLVHTAHKMSSTHRLSGDITWPEVKADRHWQGEKKEKKKKKQAAIIISSYRVPRLKVRGHFVDARRFSPLTGLKNAILSIFCDPPPHAHRILQALRGSIYNLKGYFTFTFFFFCCYFSCRLGLQPALLLRYYSSSDPMLDSLLKPLHHLSFWCLRRLLFLNMIFHFSFPWYIITRDTPIALISRNK